MNLRPTVYPKQFDSNKQNPRIFKYHFALPFKKYPAPKRASRACLSMVLLQSWGSRKTGVNPTVTLAA